MPLAIPLIAAGAGYAGATALGVGAASAIGADAIASTAADALTADAFASVGMGVGGSGYAAAAAGLTGFQELSLGSSVLSGLGSIGSSIAGEKSAKYNAEIAANNAQIARQNATASIQEGEANAAAASQSSKAKIGGMLANQGASGVDVNSGSSVDARSSAAENGELNAINIRSQAARSAYGYETSGTNATAEQNMYQSEASYAPIQGAIGAGTSLLSGAASLNSPWSSLVSGNGLGGSNG